MILKGEMCHFCATVGTNAIAKILMFGQTGCPAPKKYCLSEILHEL